IWLTNILHLNDPSEFAYGMELAANVAREIADTANWIIRAFRESLLNMVDHVEVVRSLLGLYVASFSANGDELGQWRSYGDNGRGYALGISPELFRQLRRAGAERIPANETLFVAPVLYDEQRSIQRQRQVIQKAVELVARFSDSELLKHQDVVAEFLKRVVGCVIVGTVWNSITMKHPAYRNEQETRL